MSDLCNNTTADMNARIDRVTRTMLDGDLTLPIMLRFTTEKQFRNFIRKVLVTGNVREQPHA